MTSQVLNLTSGKPRDATDALAVLDAMRAAIESGELIAFVAAGITAGDVALGYCGAVEGVTRLRMMGAIANLGMQYNAGNLG